MKITIYQVDSFTDKIFSGNPAAVCMLFDWLDSGTLHKIAMENNLAETAFVVKEKEGYHIRWFTPKVEVDLCGHATLAAAHVLFEHEHYKHDTISFDSLSGLLTVTKNRDMLTLNFPSDTLNEVPHTSEFDTLFDIAPLHIYKGKTDYMMVFESESDIITLQPNLPAISRLDARGIIVTAKGYNVDFVSRFFAPQSGIDEDPVTGSAHTTMAPYWAKVLIKKELTASQLSVRGGSLKCSYLGDRVEISGHARTYLVGEITVE